MGFWDIYVLSEPLYIKAPPASLGGRFGDERILVDWIWLISAIFIQTPILLGPPDRGRVHRRSKMDAWEEKTSFGPLYGKNAPSSSFNQQKYEKKEVLFRSFVLRRVESLFMADSRTWVKRPQHSDQRFFDECRYLRYLELDGTGLKRGSPWSGPSSGSSSASMP